MGKVMEFASAVAAIKCTRLGGRAGISTFEATVEFLAQRETKHFADLYAGPVSPSDDVRKSRYPKANVRMKWSPEL